MRNGSGKLILIDGKIFTGEFKLDRKNGYGSWILPDSSSI